MPTRLVDVPGRHLSRRDAVLDRPRPGPRLFERDERHRRDRIRPVARFALVLEDRGDVFGKGRRLRGGCGGQRNDGQQSERGNDPAHLQLSFPRVSSRIDRRILAKNGGDRPANELFLLTSVYCVTYSMHHTVCGAQDMDPNLFDTLRLELRRGSLTLAVLAQLRSEHYGYTLRKALADLGLDIDEGTLYPLLRRLESPGAADQRMARGRRPQEALLQAVARRQADPQAAARRMERHQPVTRQDCVGTLWT